MSDIEANTYTSIETPPIIDGSDGNKGISPKKKARKKKGSRFQDLEKRKSRRQQKQDADSTHDILQDLAKETGKALKKSFYELSDGGIGGRFSKKETSSWNLPSTSGHGVVHLQTCSDKGLSAVQKQDLRAVSSLDATNAETNDTTTNKNNTGVVPSSQPYDPSICFVSPLDLKKQITDNMLCRECVEKDSAETREGLCMIVPQQYHEQINSFLDVNQLSFKLDASVIHHGCASDVDICCENGHKFGCKAKSRPVKEKKGKDGKIYKKAKLSTYEENVKMLLAQYVMGVGGEEIQQFLTLLDLPHGKNYTRNGMLRVEADVGVVLRDVSDACMKKAIMDEIKATLDEKHNDWKNLYFFDPDSTDPEPLSYEKWLEIPASDRPKVPVIVSFDMGWQKRGHSSISGHAFMIGARTKKILASVVCSKECDKCKRAATNGEKAEPHPCPKNYEGSSKAMESDAALELTIRMYEEQHVFVEKIVADDDSTMKANVRHSYEEKEKKKGLFPLWSWPCTTEGQKKTSTGMLPLHIPEPGWLADPTHRTKVVGKRFFDMLKRGKRYSNITKADCLRIKKYYGYFLKQNRNRSYEEMHHASFAPLEHLFDSHEYCGAW